MIIERISNFRMVRTVSEGDHGALLHAVSDKSGERVAVRLWHGEAATPALEQSLRRAVRVSRLLAHPAVVRLIQAGRLPDGHLYLVQEQLPGETLAARLGSRPRPVMNELLRLGRQIATVLVAAHARGIIHSALRPEALQLVPDPEAFGGERVKITDWGYARVPPGAAPPVTPATDPAAEPDPAASGDADATLATRDEYPDPAPAVPLDAAAYLSPEQCRAGTAAEASAAAEVITDRVDVYALGVLLFQMAAGQLPFSGRVASELWAMHIAALPPKLEQRGVTSPAGLGNLVATMLIKDPTARPTMREVEERLQKLAQQQQQAQTMTPAQRVSQQELLRLQQGNLATLQMRVAAAPRPSAPRRSLWGLTAVLGLTAGAGLWLALGTSWGPPRPSSGGSADLALQTPAVGVQGRPPAVPTSPVTPGAPSGALGVPAKATEGPPGALGVPEKAAGDPIGALGVPAKATEAPSRAPGVLSGAPAVPPRALAASPGAPSVPAVRPGVPPLRPGSPVVIKAPARPQSPKKAPAAGKALRPAQAAAQARAKLVETQAALDNGDYAQAIEGALALLTAEPQAAATILGRAACAVDDLTLVNRAYANLRLRPAALAPVTSDCKKQGIELGISGQFVRTKTNQE